MKTQNVGSGREIEKKYRVKNFGFNQTCRNLREVFASMDRGVSTDVFFKSPGNDFVRLRQNTLELTVKRTDKGSTVDRMELNLNLDRSNKDTFNFARKWATEVFGPEVGKLVTGFEVFHTGLAAISVYHTHLSEDVFFEIEVQDEKDIQAVEDRWKFLGLEREERSLFQIFFGEKK